MKDNLAVIIKKEEKISKAQKRRKTVLLSTLDFDLTLDITTVCIEASEF